MCVGGRGEEKEWPDHMRLHSNQLPKYLVEKGKKTEFSGPVHQSSLESNPVIVRIQPMSHILHQSIASS